MAEAKRERRGGAGESVDGASRARGGAGRRQGGPPGPQPLGASPDLGPAAKGAGALVASYGSGVRAPKGATPAGGLDLEGCEVSDKDARADCYWDSARDVWEALFRAQASVLRELAETAGTELEVPPATELMLAAGRAMLAASGTSLGHLLGAALSGSPVVQATARKLYEQIHAGAGRRLGAELTALESGGVPGDTAGQARRFFLGLERSHGRSLLEVKLRLNEERATSGGSVATARGLAKLASSVLDGAVAQQRRLGVQAWARYLAQASLGVTPGRATAVTEPQRLGAVPGVLRLRGRCRVGGLPVIDSATLSGVAPGVLHTLRQLPLRALTVPLVVRLEIEGGRSPMAALVRRQGDPVATFARDEGGALLVGSASWNHAALMAPFRAVSQPMMSRAGGPAVSPGRATALACARRLFDAIGGRHVRVG